MGLVPASVHSSTAMRFASYYHLTAVNGIRGWEREQNLSILQMSLSHHCLRWWSTSSFVPRFLPPKVFWSSEVLKWWLQTVLSNFHLQWPVSLSINQSINHKREKIWLYLLSLNQILDFLFLLLFRIFKCNQINLLCNDDLHLDVRGGLAPVNIEHKLQDVEVVNFLSLIS